MGWSKFSTEKADAIVDRMRSGAGFVNACQMEGITRQTGWNWRKAGREAGRGAKCDFDRQVGEVEATHIAKAEQTVKRIMTDRADTRALNAATWYLERRSPDEYGRQEKITVEVQQQMAADLLDVLKEKLDADSYSRVLAALVPEGSGEEIPLH